MRKTPRILSLTTALAALGAPAVVPPTADAADSERGQLAPEAAAGVPVETEVKLMADGELMSFTVHRIGDNLMFPQHGSHSSHSSHASHASGSGGGWPGGWPDTPNVSSAPDPIYAPPPAQQPAATTSPSTTPPPAATADPKYLACNRANNGFGVNDIATELGQVFGMSTTDAVSMAQQALTAVFGGSHYCDGYLGDHG